MIKSVMGGSVAIFLFTFFPWVSVDEAGSLGGALTALMRHELPLAIIDALEDPERAGVALDLFPFLFQFPKNRDDQQ